MERAYLLLLTISGCWGYGFQGCTQSYGRAPIMWCVNRNIANLSEVTRMIPENITTINLSKNRIRTVPPGSFSRLVWLKDLNLAENQLVSLRGGEFKGLHLLELLNLTCNNISRINPVAFYELTSLRTLLLTHNHIRKMSPGFFRFLPQIEVVDLSLNKFKTFHSDVCGGSSSLKRLNLLANDIRRLNVSGFPALEYIRLSNNSELELQANVFAHNPRLKSLLLQGIEPQILDGLSVETKRNLSQVTFSLFVERSSLTVCGLLEGMDQLERVQVDLRGSGLPQHNSSLLLDCTTPNIVIIENANLGNVGSTRLMLDGRNTTELYLNNCGLREISQATFAGFEGLEMLQLNENNLVIHSDTFSDLKHLNSLSFGRSKISNLDTNWFVPLKKLTVLCIPKNLITEFPPNIFSALTNLEQLYLQCNVLKYITNQPFSKLLKLVKLNLSLNIINFIEKGSFQDLTSLRYLDLSGNRIMRLTPGILSGLMSLRTLVLFNNCLHFEIYETPFINMTSLTLLDMMYQGPGSHGFGHIGPHFFKDQRRLVTLAIGHSNLVDIHPDAFAPLTDLKSLYITNMVLSKVNLSAVLSPLRRLKKLRLYRADLDTLPDRLLPPGNSLKILMVHSNHLHTMGKPLLDALPRLSFLDISDNPLSCTCDNVWFKTWALHNLQTQVSYLYDLHCDNNRRSAYLWQFDDKACSYGQLSLSLFLACSVVDLLFVCVCLTWHTQGPALRYLALLLRAKWRGRRAADGARFQYDAFISYSSRDETWVMGELVPHLEAPAAGLPGFRLCLHHRDFRPGTAVLENIEAAIYSARYTVCVVTRHFLRSEWCSLEFQLASLRLLHDGSDVLLLLFLEEIPDYCLSPYTRLRKIVRKKTYLLWPGNAQERDAFWVRLVDALRGNGEEGEGEEGERGGLDELAKLIG